MIDINKVFEEEVKKINVNEIFQKALREQIQKTAESVIKDVCGSYSPLYKALEKSFKDQFDISNITVPQYMNFIVDCTEDVFKGLQSKEQAAKIKNSIREKLIPHATGEIEFDDLMSKLTTIIEDSFSEDDMYAVDTPGKWTVTCEEETKDYATSSEYYIITVKNENGYKSDRGAKLYTSSGKCYHTNGDESDAIAKLFASYVFLGTNILNIEEYDENVNQDRDY